MKIALGFR